MIADVIHSVPGGVWRRSIRGTLLVILVIASGVVGCTSIRLIGDYDDATDKAVTDVQQRAELYIAKLTSDPNTASDPSFHQDMFARLAVLKSRTASLPKYSIIEQEVELLQSTFSDFQKADVKAARPLQMDARTGRPVLAVNTEAALTVQTESILKLELALKRGDNPAGASPNTAAQ